MNLWKSFWSRNNEDCQPYNFCGGGGNKFSRKARFFSPLVKLLRKVTKPRSFLSSLLSSAESSGLQLILTIPWQD